MKVDVTIGLPLNKHVGRLYGVCHKFKKKDLHVQLDQPNQNNDYDRAHTIVLQHLEVVNPFAEKHIRELKKSTLSFIKEGPMTKSRESTTNTSRLGSKCTFKIIHYQRVMIKY